MTTGDTEADEEQEEKSNTLFQKEVSELECPSLKEREGSKEERKKEVSEIKAKKF